jgi:hypothetical protein
MVNFLDKFSQLFNRWRCTCPKKCNCQNPQPDNEEDESGVWHYSNLCPVHNLYPEPDPDCPVHGHK